MCSHIVPKTCFQGRLGNALRKAWRRSESFSQGRLLDVISERPLHVILRRPKDVRSGPPRDVISRRPRDGQIGSLGDVLGCPWDLLETDICQLG